MSSPLEPSINHSDAVKSLLELAFTPYQYGLYVGETGDDPLYPYAVLWPTPGQRPADRLKGYGGEIVTREQVTCAGLSPDDATGIADRVSGALHRVRPTITGRVCGYIEQDQDAMPGPPLRDPRTVLGGRLAYFVPLFFTLRSSAILHP